MTENLVNISSMFSLWKPGIVQIGNIPLGGSFPVRIQSMTNTPTLDTDATVKQCIRMIEAGCELVRVTAQNLKEAENLAVIKKELRKAGFMIPLIADVHFNPAVALKAARIVEKVRINPGNYAEKRTLNTAYTNAGYKEEIEKIAQQLLPLLKVCKENGTAIRIGTNHGSLSGRIMDRYGDTPLGMAESAMEFVRICHDAGFQHLVLSMKSSNVRVMVEATRLLVHKMITENMMFPVHLGVTEAGNDLEGRMKSAAGIGTLLADGIGDTIRVSLTETPENEIPVARQIVSFFPKPKRTGKDLKQATELRFTSDFAYERRISSLVGNIGNGNAPVVLRELDAIHTIDELGHAEGNHGNWFAESEPDAGLGAIRYLIADPLQDHVFPHFSKQLSENDCVLVLKLTSPESIIKIRSIINELDRIEPKVPIILAFEDANTELSGFAIDAALRLSPLLNDGLCDGIFLRNKKIDPEKVNDVAFGLLQATRARITQTEYIACPGCGRTQYKLEEAFEKVKAATSHLKGLKIAVMGCIVNGPGEMADADYGYVGQGSGKVSIYKGKTPLMKNIAEDNAIDALISVIADHGQWVSP
ncbi:MAG: (E)-4-hydroxy-3-methylbut-2-enyl-diphosphate synthase [Bacteroidales bacterium]|nr:(E)-4-hydroxy-3-methylbut-2-enyl-diphosphate synthase [Bacteroidales bacterium]